MIFNIFNNNLFVLKTQFKKIYIHQAKAQTLYAIRENFYLPPTQKESDLGLEMPSWSSSLPVISKSR